MHGPLSLHIKRADSERIPGSSLRLSLPATITGLNFMLLTIALSPPDPKITRGNPYRTKSLLRSIYCKHSGTSSHSYEHIIYLP